MLKRILLKYFIRHDYPSLKLSDKAGFAIADMDVWKVKHLPVVEDEKYVSLVAESDLSQFPADTLIGDIVNLAAPSPYIDEESHVLEAFRMMSQCRLSVLPVITEEGLYKGLLTQELLFFAMGELLPLAGNVSLLVVEMPQRDQNLSALAHLVEANNAHILYYTTQFTAGNENVFAYFIVDLEDPSPILMSLERFNYKVVYHSSKQRMCDLYSANRWEELMRYMNV